MSTKMKSCPIIAVAGNKGGTGKSSSISALACIAAKKNKVLIIDCDPQGSLEVFFGFRTNDDIGPLGKALYEKIEKPDEYFNINDIIYNYPDQKNIDILCSGTKLKQIYDYIGTKKLMSQMKVFPNLFKDIKALNKYDYIFMDTAPSVGKEIEPIFAGVEYVYTPLLEDVTSLYGAIDIENIIEEVQEVNNRLTFLGVFFARVYTHSRAYNEIRPKVHEHFQDKLFSTIIPDNRAVASQDQNQGYPIVYRSPSSSMVKAYEKLWKEMVKRIE